MASPLGNLFGKMAEKRSQSDSDRNVSSSSALGVVFKRMGSNTSEGRARDSDNAGVKPALTSALIQEVAAKERVSSSLAVADHKKRRYNNSRRQALAQSKAKGRKGVAQSRANKERVQAHVSKKCLCSLETCFSQFQSILLDLLALLSLFSEQSKGVRDCILRKCIGGRNVCVMGLRMSLDCFRALFQMGKMQAQSLAKQDFRVDGRLKGNPKKPRSKVQEKQVRLYLITVYSRCLPDLYTYIFTD